ncbi:MAG TPA: hypothetical protein VGF71_15990 [Caulobacteraceae bacterium]|jgi:hypothetical protein
MVMLLPLPFRKLWLGQQSLPRAFWFYGFFLYCVLFFACKLALTLSSTGLMIGLTTVVMWSFAVLMWVGIWRSANAYSGNRWWAITAKVAVGFAVIWYVAGFFRHGGFDHLLGLLMGSS